MIDKSPANDNILDNFPNSWNKPIKSSGKFLVRSQSDGAEDCFTIRSLSGDVTNPTSGPKVVCV